MVIIHHPTILTLLETRITDHKTLADELGFHYFIQSLASRLSVGIVILWKDDSISISKIFVPSQAIHATI